MKPLVVSALSLLVVMTIAAHIHEKPNSLNDIIDQAEKYNETLNKEFFVEDVRTLVEAGCKDTFFCKVYDILHKRQEIPAALKNNLKTFTDQRHVNCTELLQDVTPTGVRIQLPELMKLLTTCAQRRNWNKGKKNSPE